jgi:protein-S-isoprenylcysteine O-methyltransferase Ste14
VNQLPRSNEARTDLEPPSGERRLALRSLVNLLLLPGSFGVALPLAIAWRSRRPNAAWPFVGAVLIAVGFAGLVWCVVDFARRGRGTLAPWDPPRRLVVEGLYRFVRNPMYVAVLTLVLGVALAAGSRSCGLYAAALAVAFHLRVVSYEEPQLARQFPQDWSVYRGAVRRWIPRISPWRGERS